MPSERKTPIPVLTPAEVKTRLKQIADEIKAGATHERFEKEMDRLLETSMTARDADIEAAWEEDYRNTGDL